MPQYSLGVVFSLKLDECDHLVTLHECRRDGVKSIAATALDESNVVSENHIDTYTRCKVICT